MRRKPSAAEILARQSEERGDSPDMLVALARTRLRSVEKKREIILAPAQHGRDEVTLDIAFIWERLDEASAELFAIGLAIATMYKGYESARSQKSELKSGLFAYIDDVGTPMKPGSMTIDLRKVPRIKDVDEALLRDFKRFLDTTKSSLSEQYRKEMIETAQFVIDTIKSQPGLASHISPRFQPLSNLYPNRDDGVTHTQPIDDLDFDDIVDAALAECEAIMERDREQQIRMADLEKSLPSPSEDDLLAYAVHLKRAYARHFKENPTLRKKELRLGKLVSAEFFDAAEAIVFPDERELIPFIVAIAAIFGLNPSTVIRMTVDDWEERKILGVRRLRLFPKKKRAKRRQRFEISITDDADHPFELLEYLKRRTQPLRDLRPAYCKRQLFVRWGRNPREVRDMATPETLPGRCLARFIEDNKLATFALKQLRITAMDRVHELTGDLVRTSAFANHASLTTTEQHYPSAARLRREQERMGRAMELRHRDIATDWQITSFDLPPDLDKVAATPGFGCRDPYLGEIETEQPGRLCAAYGHCAGCRLAKVDYGSARVCAYLHQLRERIDEAQLVIGAEAWLIRWSPVKRKLLLKLDRFAPAVQAAAASIVTTKLPPVE